MDTVLFYPPAAGDEAEGSEPTQKSCGLEKKPQNNELKEMLKMISRAEWDCR